MEHQHSDPAPSTHPDLDHVWFEYRGALMAFLRSRVRDPDDAEDLLQDILIKTQKKLGSLEQSASLKSWLFQIANNTIIDFYRRKARTSRVHPDDLWYTDLDAADRHVLEGCVSPFMKALPAEAADLLRRIELDGVPQKQLAAELGLSYSTLKSRVQTARRQLRALFEGCCEFSVDGQGKVIDYHPKAGGCAPC